MASSFSNDADLPDDVPERPAATPPATEPAAVTPPAAEPALAAPDAPTASAAVLRFRSCRWYQAPEAGVSEFCTHREVKPYAGTTAFDAGAWCPDCVHFKLRRTPKKRDYSNYGY